MSRELPRPDLNGLTPDVLAWIEQLEKFAGAKTISVTSNNKFPAWSFERWALVIGFAVSLVVQVFVVGERFGKVETRLAGIESREVEHARKDVMESWISNLRAQIERKADKR